MMKMKRFVSMVLVLVFVLSFAAAASAAEITWESGNGRYSASAVITSFGTSVALFTSTTMYHHWNPYNMATVISADTFCTTTGSVSWTGQNIYRHILEQLVVEEGLRLSSTFYLSAGSSLNIPGDAETGEYMICALYPSAAGSWSVWDLNMEPKFALGSGSFYDAPRSTGCSYGYYKVG